MKRVIFLIISSNDIPAYSAIRDIGRQHYKSMQRLFGYRYFFLENRDMDEEIVIDGDIMYIKGTERYYGILDKTMKAYQYINTHMEYDIVIRTNLSSFWNVCTLYNGFLDDLYQTGVATGICNSMCISGSGIILSRDVCMKLCDNVIYSESHADDVIIRQNLERFMAIQPITHTMRYDFLDGPNNVFPSNLHDYVYFRVKNNDRMRYDVAIFKELAKRLGEEYVIAPQKQRD